MFSSCKSRRGKMWQTLITQNHPLMPSEDNEGDRCRLTNCCLVHDLHARWSISLDKCYTKQARCVDQDKADGHEELDALAPLPSPASPQGVGGQLPDDTFKNLYDAQVFQSRKANIGSVKTEKPWRSRQWAGCWWHRRQRRGGGAATQENILTGIATNSLKILVKIFGSGSMCHRLI